MNTELLMVNINTRPGRVDVDYRPAQADINWYDPHDSGRIAAERAREKGIEGIGEIARRGNRLGRIETGHTIPDEAKLSLEAREVEVDLGYMRGPEVNLEPAVLDIEFSPRGRNINVLI